MARMIKKKGIGNWKTLGDQIGASKAISTSHVKVMEKESAEYNLSCIMLNDQYITQQKIT